MSEHGYGQGNTSGRASSSRTVSVVHNATATGRASSSRTVGKNHSATARGRASYAWQGGQSVKEFWERSPIWFAGVIAIAILSPVIGLFIHGVWGFLIGLLISIVDWIVGRRAERKVREIRERGEA